MSASPSPERSRKRKSNFSDAPQGGAAVEGAVVATVVTVAGVEVEVVSGQSTVARVDAPPDSKVADFLASISSDAPTPKPAPPIYFDVVRDATEGADLLGRLDLSGSKQLTFGRDPTRVDIPLEHGSISRHHATLTFDGSDAYISDIRSTHGTFLIRKLAKPQTGADFLKNQAMAEEKRLDPREITQLFPGDTIRFGESSRRYVFGLGPARAEAAAHGVMSAGGEIKIALRVPSNTVGRLIGKGGATIAAVQQRTLAHVTVLPPERTPPGADGRPDPSSRIVEVRGEMQNVAAARLELLAITAGEPPTMFNALGQGGGQRFRYASTIVNGRGDEDDLVGGFDAVR